MGGDVGPSRRDDYVTVNSESLYRFGYFQRRHDWRAVGGPPYPHRGVGAADDDRGAIRQRPAYQEDGQD